MFTKTINGSMRITGGIILGGKAMGCIGEPSAITTAGNAAYSAANLLTGIISRDPNGDDRADTLPTAAALVAAIPGAIVGTSFGFAVQNRSNAESGETITVTAPNGAVTVSGVATIALGKARLFRVRLTNRAAGSEAYTAYSIGLMDV